MSLLPPLLMILTVSSAPAKPRVQAAFTLQGHKDTLTCLAYAADGRTLASGAKDGKVLLWDNATRKVRFTLSGHGRMVTALAFSSDGKLLATAGYDRGIHLWNPATGKELARLPGHRGEVRGLAFVPGSLLVSAGTDGTLKLWDLRRRKERATLPGHTDAVNCVAVAPDGKTIASGSWDRTVRLWDASRGKVRAVLRGHTDMVRTVAFSPDGRWLASAGKDGILRTWDAATGKPRAVLRGHKSLVRCLAFAPDGKLLASGGRDGTLRLWDAASGRLQATVKDERLPFQALAFAPDGKTLATGGIDGRILLHDVASLTRSGRLPCRNKARDTVPGIGEDTSVREGMGRRRELIMWKVYLHSAMLLLVAGIVLSVSAAEKKTPSKAPPSPRDDMRQMPVILKPEDFQTAYVRGQFPSQHFQTDNEGRISKVWVLRKGIKSRAVSQRVELIPLAEAKNRTLAFEALPLRMVIVVAGFPYEKQVEEFRRKLRLPNLGAVLSERIREAKGLSRPSFQFQGLEIERRMLSRSGKAGTWKPLDVAAVYRPLVLATAGRFEKEDPRLRPILQISRGLMMALPTQYPGKHYPKPEANLRTIQKTLKNLKKTPLDYCLIRFLDPTVEPGKAYQYRFKVKMTNPNYALDPRKRKDTFPRFARAKQLASDWATVPQTVAVPSDEFLYAVDQTKVKTDKLRFRAGSTPTPNQAVFQIQRWVESYSRYPRDTTSWQNVGEWLVAPRFFVERGEFVKPPPDFRVEVPVRKLGSERVELDTRLNDKKREVYLMLVPFGDRSVLVDFEGGRSSFSLESGASGRTIKTVRVVDQCAREVLIMRPDGTMIARNTITDAADSVRVRRYRSALKLIGQARKNTKTPGTNRPFRD